jgi:hypothetical protein
MRAAPPSRCAAPAQRREALIHEVLGVKEEASAGGKSACSIVFLAKRRHGNLLAVCQHRQWIARTRAGQSLVVADWCCPWLHCPLLVIRECHWRRSLALTG